MEGGAGWNINQQKSSEVTRVYRMLTEIATLIFTMNNLGVSSNCSLFPWSLIIVVYWILPPTLYIMHSWGSTFQVCAFWVIKPFNMMSPLTLTVQRMSLYTSFKPVKINHFLFTTCERQTIYGTFLLLKSSMTLCTCIHILASKPLPFLMPMVAENHASELYRKITLPTW